MTWFTRFNFSILHVNEVIIEWLVLVVLVDLQGVVLVVVPHSAGGGWVVSQGLTQHPQHHRHTGHQHHGLLTGHRSLVHRSWSWPGDRRGGESGSVRRGVRRMRRCLPPAPTATLSWLTVLVQDQHSQLCSSLLQPVPACDQCYKVMQPAVPTLSGSLLHTSTCCWWSAHTGDNNICTREYIRQWKI